jgi:nucleoside-diphosphate-sugar epimerase
MNVAITGASGFIGSVIARHACEQGHTVTALVRETSNKSHIAQYVDKFVTGTHDDSTAVLELLEKADVVIHNSFDWAALQSGDMQVHFESNLRGSINLLEASDQRHFIYISSIAVHHHMHERWEGSIDETHPTRPGSLYGACKAAVEAHLWQAHAQRNQHVTAIRPCAVYGIDPNLKRSIGWPIVQTIQAGKPYTKLGGGKFVHVDDVAAATIACIANPKASPNVYNLVDCYARWADWALLAAEGIGCEVEIDQSSPEAPKNTFITTNVANDLGVMLNRGTDGIRKQIQDLINV